MILFLVVLFIISFAAINVANLQREHVNNQTIADLGSRYGANMTTRTADVDEIKAQVDLIVNDNLRLANQLSSNHSVVSEYGSVDSDSLVFVPNAKPLNSVRVQINSDVKHLGFMSGRNQPHNVVRDATAGAFHQDVCVVLDRSSSMCFYDDLSTYPDFAEGNPLIGSTDPAAAARAHLWWQNWAHPKVTRWARLIESLEAMADSMSRTHQTELLSLVSYSHNHDMRFWDYSGTLKRYRYNAAEVEANLTFDYESAVSALKTRYATQRPVYGHTNIGAGIAEATKVLTSSSTRVNAFKTMVVMTDGHHNEGENPTLAAERAAKLGIRVVGITFSSGASQSTMQAVAKAGNGIHFHADTGLELKKIFSEIVNLPTSAYID